MRDGIFLARGKHLHGRIISLRVEVWAHRTSLYPTLFIEMPVPCKECERSCIGVLQISILPLSTILIFNFEIVPTVWYFLFLILFCSAINYLILINSKS